MRFIGGKSILLDNIVDVINKNTENVQKVGDLFTGSGVVSQTFKRLGYEVVTNDLMYMSYCLGRGQVELNIPPTFKKLGINDVFTYLNNLNEPSDKSKCFIYNNYSPGDDCKRMYFQPDNAWKIDAIRMQIESWHQLKKVTEAEYYYLLACLLSAVPYVANIAGVYAAYLKHWDKRTYNSLDLKPLEIISSEKCCRAYNLNADEVCKMEYFDLVYIDTPYNSRQYGANYHVLETIARYDYPNIHGVTGMRDYKKSEFCQKSVVSDAFYRLFQSLNTRYAVVSYNNEGLLTTEEMMNIIGNFGHVKLYEYPYRRYKSKIPNNKSGLKEQIYFVEMIK